MIVACTYSDGLSFTTFGYSDLKIAATARACDSIPLSVTVTNTGSVASDEVLQVYVATPNSTVPSPRIRLAAFKRIRAVQPGASASVVVQLAIQPDAHAVVVPAEQSVYIEQLKVEAGTLRVYVGGSQPSDLAKAAGQTAQQSNGIWASVDITAASMLHMCSPPPPQAAA